MTIQNNLKYIACYTLVDITETRVSRIPSKNVSDSLRTARNQQRNWETLIQTIGIRAQPIYLETALTSTITDFGDWMFGDYYKPPARVWLFVFGVEHLDVFSSEDHELGKLNQDLDCVPVIENLTESVEFYKPVFCTQGSYKNTNFIPLTSDFFNSV